MSEVIIKTKIKDNERLPIREMKKVKKRTLERLTCLMKDLSLGAILKQYKT